MPTLLTPPPRRTDRGREFLADNPVESVTFDDGPACLVSVRLPSYRSLPLSCLADVSLSIDGAPIAPGNVELLLQGHAYSLDELARLSHVWWFILDVAQLRVRLSEPLSEGDHTVRGQLVTVEPYISNGRFHFVSTSQRTLPVVAGRQQGVFNA